MPREAPLAPGRHSAPKRDRSVEEYLAVLDSHDISHGVLTASSFYGTDDSLLLDALDRAAGRLRGTVIVAPDIDRAALEAMGERGAVGIRLNWFWRASSSPTPVTLMPCADSYISGSSTSVNPVKLISPPTTTVASGRWVSAPDASR